jgi:hypothetical protein
LGNDVFNSSVSKRYIYVPIEALNAYKEAAEGSLEHWWRYSSNIVGYDYGNSEPSNGEDVGVGDEL